MYTYLLMYTVKVMKTVLVSYYLTFRILNSNKDTTCKM